MNKICTKCEKLVPHYAKGFCRPCYRKETGEGKKYWLKTKDSSKEIRKDRWNKYYAKVKDTDEWKKKQKIHHDNYYKEHSEEIKKKVLEWKKKQPVEKKRLWAKRDNVVRQFGDWDKVENLLSKYNHSCAICFLSNDAHKRIYESRLSIHHINGLGRNVPRYMKDNRLENLVPVCKPCHQKLEKGSVLIDSYLK